MRKRSSSSQGSDKSVEPPCFLRDKKLLSFNYQGLSCFIGDKSQGIESVVKNRKKEKRFKTSSSFLAHSQSSDNQNPLMSLRVPRSKKGKVPSNSNNAFNSSILLLEYEGEEEKPETKPNDKKDSNSEEEDQEVVHVLNSCMRVITEDTEHSSHPNSARFTPQASTPNNMTMDVNPMMMQMIYPSDYYYHMQRQSPTPTVRNRRAITNEQSKDYVINLNSIGRDGRTTIMVRNIPNKYTQDMLLTIFEKHHKKKFDFFYLPIDYNNSCNVGYAFLNFIDTRFIRQFYLEFHEKKWNRFNSSKVCRVCYARIQGTVQLQNHFQHSNVIQQKERRYRPLIGFRSFKEDISVLVKKQQKQNYQQIQCYEENIQE